MFIQLNETTWVRDDTIEGFDVRGTCVGVWLGSGESVTTSFTESEWLKFLGRNHKLVSADCSPVDGVVSPASAERAVSTVDEVRRLIVVPSVHKSSQMAINQIKILQLLDRLQGELRQECENETPE